MIRVRPVTGTVPISVSAKMGLSRWRCPIHSGKERVEIVVRADPDPDNRIAITLTNCAVLLIDSHRPNLVIADELLETQRGVARVLGKLGVSPPCRLAYAGAQCAVRSPEAGAGQGFQRRSKSMGVEGSAADWRKKASSFGRRWPEAIKHSQRPSSSLVRRNRAKSPTSARLSSGSDSQILTNSSVSMLIV